MQKRRAGFTLIELLIVIVIIGILAAIAIPKFGRTREKAYFKAMQTDLRNLAAQQEIYFSNPGSNYTYAADVADLTDFDMSQGVTVEMVDAGQTGWSATAAHAAITDGRICAMFTQSAAAVAPAVSAGIPQCSE